MEIIDAHDIEPSLLISNLLSNDNLPNLAYNDGVLCFILSDPIDALDMYNSLIRNSSSIDYITGKLIAFIMFYGEVEDEFGRKVEGLSGSSQRKILDLAIKSKIYGAAFREDPDSIARYQYYSHMARCSRALLEHYELPLGLEPCLLFVNPKSSDNFILIELDRKNTLDDMIRNVLPCISNNTELIKKYDKLRREVDGLRATLVTAEALPKEIDNLTTLLYSEQEKNSKKVADLKFRSNNLSELRGSINRGDAASAQLVVEYCKEIGIKIDEGLFKESMKTISDLTQIKKIAKSKKQRRGLSRRIARILDSEDISKIIEDLNHRINDLKEEIKSPFWQIRCKLDELNSQLVRSQAFLRSRTEKSLSKLELDLEAIKKSLLDANISEDAIGNSGCYALLAAASLKSKRRKYFSAKEDTNSMIKILLLAANPLTTTRLDLEEEIRGIEIELSRSKFRDVFSLEVSHAVRPEDLVRSIRELEPNIIHFSGHGEIGGIRLRSEGGASVLVGEDSLARVFRNKNVSLVVLNSCYSDNQAEAILTSVPSIIGTTSAVGDDAARRFSTAFYSSLGNGNSIGESFEDAVSVVSLYNLADVFRQYGNSEKRFF